jgi:N-acetylglutamate synthase-like GNAT family acetyltransferase
MKIRSAEAGDFPTIYALLTANALPTEAVQEMLGDFVVAEDGLDVIGVAGVERCGEYGLLRSVAVDEKWRSHGVARRLVDRLIETSRARGFGALYLLTETAKGYFSNFGFETTARDAAPASIRDSHEFTHACPASATVMKLELDRVESARATGMQDALS